MWKQSLWTSTETQADIDKTMDSTFGVKSVLGEQLDPQKTTDDTDSIVKDNQALGTVLANYSVCLQNAQQLVSLQSWILETKASVDKQNADRGLDISLPEMPWKKGDAQ